MTDLNYIEDSAGGSDVTVGILSKLEKITLLQVKRSRILVVLNF
jgi:exosome complex component RRP41